MSDNPLVYKSACGKTFQPPHFPNTKRCSCGAEITVNKPARVVESTEPKQTARGVMWEKK